MPVRNHVYSIVPRYMHPAVRKLVKEIVKPNPDLERTREMIGYLMTAQLQMEDLVARGHPCVPWLNGRER
jgi:hypothetical protein